MLKRRMIGWQPLATENTDVLTAPRAPAEPEPVPRVSMEPAVANQHPNGSQVPNGTSPEVAVQSTTTSRSAQDPNVPRRRMAGWQPLSAARDGAPIVVASATAAAATETSAPATGQSAPVAAPVAPAPVTEDLPRRRMGGWAPLKVGHPDTAAPVAEQQPVATPAAEPTPVPVADAAPAAPRRRMGAPATAEATPAAAPPRRMGAAPTSSSQSATAAPAKPAAQPAVTTPQVVTPEQAKPATRREAQKSAPKKEMSKVTKVALTLLGVAVVAAGLVLLAQWLRTLDPVANFIATYDGTPTHPDGVEAGIPAWVGWQHFFNFFIMAMVIRSGFLIRNQERPEAYWTPNDGGFFSPNKMNSPQKVSIQQWIHQSFNVLWVVNGLAFYIMVFATGHWMRIVPTNWDIFPNIVSAGVQYMSLDWPAENSWIYYNALQIMTYFITVFIAAPLAVLTGLRLSTWWPQKADGINKVFTLPVARKIHFFTMVYFILFIIVHLFLVFTTGVLTNMNIMFTAREASDWWGIGVFALSVAATVGVAWLIKPIFVSPIAEKTGTVSTR